MWSNPHYYPGQITTVRFRLYFSEIGNKVLDFGGKKQKIGGDLSMFLAELDGSGQSKREYIFLNGKMVAKFGQGQFGRKAVVAPWLYLLLGKKN